MKILVVCQYYKPEPFRIADICEEMVRAGHEVTVVTGVPNYPAGEVYYGYEKSAGKQVDENGVSVRRCYTIPRKQGALYRVLNYFSFAISSTCFLSMTKEEYDVVFVNQLSPVMMAFGAIRYAKKWKKKVVLYCLDLWPESLLMGGISADSIIYRAFKRISQYIYGNVDRILITSKGFASYINEFLGVSGSCEYLPQYAETLYDHVEEWKAHSEPFHFMFAGNIGEAQAVDTLIGAAACLKDDPRVVFDIVGSGSAFAYCQDIAKDLPNVKFHGRKDVSEMPEYYAMADAMIVSLKDNVMLARTLPGKVQSYMAAGRTIVGSIGGETADVIAASECGICAAPENPEELADKIRELLDHQERFSSYGKNARAYYSVHFRKEVFMEKLLSELKNCCES